jgi:UDP-glucose 4-epimerase
MEYTIGTKKNTILITGGSGYIGSHVCLELIESGFKVVVIDSLENSNQSSIRAVQKYCNDHIPFYHAKVQDVDVLRKIFTENKIMGVIHMAGYKSVKQSVKSPDAYYDNNLLSTIQLLKTMDEFGCNNLIFSSSATVYGDANGICTESSPLGALNPYGETKLLIEQIMNHATGDSNRDIFCNHSNLFTEQDIPISDKWRFVSLRYFNPIGAHQSHIIGENPNGVPENLVPYIMKVMSGDLDKLTIFGNNYDTLDKTAIRDYVHVTDLAKAHVQALKYLLKLSYSLNGTHDKFNIGTGTGYSVLKIIRTFESLLQSRQLNGEDLDVTLCWDYGDRREGDSACCYADSTKARTVLGWEPIFDIDQMCRDAWLWWRNNSN